MKTGLIDWIWHIRGDLALAPGQSDDEAFRRLAPLFRTEGTAHETGQDRLTFRKKNPASQDRMAVFDSGVLQIEHGASGLVLRYHLTSRALLLCFLAPLLFLAFAQVDITLGKFDKPAARPAATKTAEAAVNVPMNPVDQFLGAPKPDKKDGHPEAKDKHSPTSAYVFAGIFAALYLIGRVLEDRLVKSLFRKRLLAARSPGARDEVPVFSESPATEGILEA